MMSDRNAHTILSHLSHPKRFIGLTIDEAVIAVIGALFEFYVDGVWA
jgi:hypothetical protein